MFADPKLPDTSSAEMDFLESSFFLRSPHGTRLPTPAEVRTRAQENHLGRPKPPPVVFEDLNLIVKFGTGVTVAEAQNLWYIKKVFGNAIPVPELFAWRVDGDSVFIYMEYVRGQTLKARWDTLDDSQRTDICSQLCQIVSTLRSYRQNSSESFIGSVRGQPLLDIVFENQPQAGPFPDVMSFNDYFMTLPQKWLPASERYEDPNRYLLPDHGLATLTHGDLHRANIIVSEGRVPRVLAVIDWAHAGWYPDYWEYCKAVHTCTWEEDWRSRYIPQFITPRIQEEDIYVEYTTAIGAL